MWLKTVKWKQLTIVCVTETMTSTNNKQQCSKLYMHTDIVIKNQNNVMLQFL